jgi:hypothetical protein
VRAVVSSAGVVTAYRAKAPDRTVSSQDVQDPEQLARLIQEQRQTLHGLPPGRREIIFEDVATGTAGALLSLPHGIGGRVLWSVVDWASTAGGAAPILEKDDTTSNDTLVLASYVAGTATIRIEAVS